MDVALGVAVTDAEAYLTLLDTSAPHAIVDRSKIAANVGGIADLVSTLVLTDRQLAAAGHRLVMTRICGVDSMRCAALAGAVTEAELVNVAVVGPSQVMDTAVTGASQVDPAPTLNSREDDTPEALGFAAAREAAVVGLEQSLFDTAAAVTADATRMTPAAEAATGVLPTSTTDDLPDRPLAYSAVDENPGLWTDSHIAEGVSADGSDSAGRHGPKTILALSTFAGAVVLGLAVLAVIVAVGSRPTVTQQAIRTQEPAIPGQYFPISPGQGVSPDGQNWTAIERLPEAGAPTDVRSFQPKSLTQAADDVPIINIYRDGTVGMAAVDAPGTAGPVPGTLPGTGGIDAAEGLTSRLIPDYTMWSPADVVYLLSNSIRAVATAAVSTAAVLSQIGSVVAVPATMGPLFPAAPVTGVLAAAPGAGMDAATLGSTIPRQVFDAQLPASEKAAVLPMGAQLVTRIPAPAATTADGAPALLGPITDLEALGPTVRGTGPLPAPPSLEQIEAGSGWTPLSGLPSAVPKLPAPEVGTGSPSTRTGGGAAGPKNGLDVMDRLPTAPFRPAPPANVTDPAAPSVKIEAPKVDLPKVEPPKTDLPNAPAVELPSLPAPRLPDPKVEIPAPAPKLPAAPAPQLPDLPKLPQSPQVPNFPQLPEMPKLPQLPSFPSGGLGGLFGGGGLDGLFGGGK